MKKSIVFIIKNCLTLLKCETDCCDEKSKEYKLLLDIIIFLEIKLGELIDED